MKDIQDKKKSKVNNECTHEASPTTLTKWSILK